MKKILILITLLILTIGLDICVGKEKPKILSKQINIIEDPISLYAKEYLKEYVRDLANESIRKTFSLVRIITDFNNDGLEDIALSDNSMMGNGGGPFKVYLKDKTGNYKYIGILGIHPAAINIQPIKKGVTKIIGYWHMSAIEGYLFEYSLSNDGIKNISRKLIKPGDAEYGGNDEDKKLFDKLFGNRKPISEYCKLIDYIKDKNCKWEKGY